MQCIALRHVAFEDLGTFAPLLRAHGYDIDYRDAGVTPLSDAEWRDTDLVVVLGGPIGVNDSALYPWLEAQRQGLQARLALRKPTLGICLGAQLMAVALGATVAARGGPEIGWHGVTLTAAGAQGPLRHLDNVPVLHWHGENFTLPDGAHTLAASDGTPQQAIAIGRHALGLQFHAEFDPRALEAWLVGHTVELRQAGIDLARLRRDTALHGAALTVAATALLDEWLHGLACS